jgi:uncharacterized protein YbjT (DUF2867 family)
MKVLATGATGKFARLVVPALVSHGIEVRAVGTRPGQRRYPAGLRRQRGRSRGPR